jgi:hypothetical protein
MTASLAEKALGLLNPSLLRSRKRPARTPPSTFLFLPIHFSNSPEPRSSVVPTFSPAEPKNFLRLVPKNIKPATSDAANEHGHKEHGRMLGHRVKQ